MRLIFFILVSLLLAGCGGEEYQDLRDFVKNSGADMRGKIEPPPEVKPYEHFAYANDTNLPDPFKPRKPEKRPGGGGINQPDLHRVKAGNYIGLNFGLIKEVTDTEIIIKEMVQDSAGDWSERVSTLQLLE